MNNSISVIIPFCNSINTISRLFDSIFQGQVIPNELICVDDGSTDASKALVLEYARKYPCIKVLSQSHQGVSAARNLGLQNAHGDWISFLDSDDYIEPDMYSLMIDAVSSNDYSVDGCVCGYYTHKDGIQTSYTTREYYTLSSNEMLRHIFTDDAVRGFLVTRLFRADILKDISFEKELSVCEDLVFQTKLFTSKDLKFAVVEKPLYHYVQNETSATVSKKLFDNDEFIYAKAYDIISNILNEDYVQKSYDSILEYSMYTLLLNYKENGSSELLKEIRLLQKEMKKTGQSKEGRSKRRLAFEIAPVIYGKYFMR